ncbi:MAG TPA: hypothetical protein VEF04_11020, partial [Blastocatellia bacterium]|nr:hypothetical protein [Blastocatellia bacterium]
MLARNSSRENILVMRSGVQLERISEGDQALRGESKGIEYANLLKNPNVAQSLVWTVRVLREDACRKSGKEVMEVWTMQSVPRGIKEALSTGLFIPETSWRMWIPGEHSGDLLDEFSDENKLAILRVHVLGVQSKEKSVASIVA